MTAPASFNAEATRRGARVVSCDPIYRLNVPQIEERIAATYDQIIDQTRRNAHEFVWHGQISNVKELGQVRMAAMRTFLDDYDLGRTAGRYIDAELPVLPFADGTFEIALCSHSLFLYSAQLGGAFHRAAIRELCRVAGEVRLFPPSHWAESDRRSWIRARETCATWAAKYPLSEFRTSFSEAATR